MKMAWRAGKRGSDGEFRIKYGPGTLRRATASEKREHMRFGKQRLRSRNQAGDVGQHFIEAGRDITAIYCMDIDFTFANAPLEPSKPPWVSPALKRCHRSRGRRRSVADTGIEIGLRICTKGWQEK